MSTEIQSLAELLGASRNAANRTRSNEAPSPCVSCKRTLTILPLRYGVVSGANQASVEHLAPKLPANLGKKLTPKLTGSRYAVRSLREGYVYVFLKRRGKAYVCEATYRVHDSGLLQPVWPYDPGTPVGGVLGLGGWTLSIGDPEDVDEARLLFTYDPLSPAMVDRYRDVSLYRDRLQKFDLRTLAQTCSNFDDVVNPHSLDTTVAEFLATSNADAKKMLETQAFPPFRNALTPGDTAKDMGSIYNNARDSLKGNGGVALVLYDAVGIVQELNAWRNDAIEINRPWLQEKDKNGITNERRLVVANALDNIKTAMEKGYIENATKDAEAKLKSAKDRDLRFKARFGYNPENLQEIQAHYHPDRVQERAAKAAPDAFKRYEDLLDWEGAKKDVQAEFARQDQRAQEEMDKREADHLAWLDSDLLKHALDLYDRKAPVWGQAFAEQIGLCLLGMNGCDSGSAKLAEWWSDIAIGERNLAWRALTRNQFEIEEATKNAMAKAQAGDVLTADNMVGVLTATNKNFKSVADVLSKADNAVELALAAGTHKWFGADRLSRSLSLFAQAHQYLFKLLPANAVDRRLLVPMLGFIHANLGARVTNLRLEEFAAAGQTASRARVAGQVNSQITKVRNTLANDFQNRGGGQFYKVRAGVVVAILESVALLTTAAGSDKGTKEYAELTAAGLVTAAAGFELAATGVESVSTRFAQTTVIGRGASIALGGLKFWGGSLATVGGGILTVVAAIDAKSAFESDRRGLGYAYLGQTIVSAGITALSTSLALSASGTYLRWLLLNTERATLRFLLPGLIRAATTLAIPHVAAALGLALGWATVAGVVITVVIAMASPDALESWCTHSCLGRREPNSVWKPFTDEGKELAKLYAAFDEVN